MIFASIFGSVGEIIETHFHVWSYSVATPLGIPAWLPFVWSIAVYVIFQISQIFNLNLKNGFNTWCVPGGKLEFKENPETCAERDVMEEAGIRRKDLRFGG